MKFSRSKSLMAFAAGLALAAVTGAALGQQSNAGVPVPRFVTLPPTNTGWKPLSSSLPTWNFAFTYKGIANDPVIVGADPSGNATTTVPVFIIPIILKEAGDTFSPKTVQSNGKTALVNTTASPLFKDLTFTEGGTNLGDTQYIDAYQRADFWSTVSTNTSWHTLFGKPTVLPVQTLTVPKADGSIHSPFGLSVATVDINYFDAKVQTLIAKFPQITPDSIPIFMVYDTYLTDGGYPGGCCIGGYHSYNGSNVYSVFSYIGVPGEFAEDVAALSHELGELVMDPFTNTPSNCSDGGLLEVGDPLEGDANFGTYTYALGGFTYHLQDLVLITYFGAPLSTTLDKRITFQGTKLSVCENGS
jgi:hypothetical protein